MAHRPAGAFPPETQKPLCFATTEVGGTFVQSQDILLARIPRPLAQGDCGELISEWLNLVKVAAGSVDLPLRISFQEAGVTEFETSLRGKTARWSPRTSRRWPLGGPSNILLPRRMRYVRCQDELALELTEDIIKVRPPMQGVVTRFWHLRKVS